MNNLEKSKYNVMEHRVGYNVIRFHECDAHTISCWHITLDCSASGVNEMSHLLFLNTDWRLWYIPLNRRNRHGAYIYSRTCYDQPHLWHRKSGLLRQVAAHRRFICIENVIWGNGQVASHNRLAAHKMAPHSRFYCNLNQPQFKCLHYLVFLSRALIIFLFFGLVV